MSIISQLWSFENTSKKIVTAGVDRGAILIEGQKPIPWNGLISVDETPVLTKSSPVYIDGNKVFNLPVRYETNATVKAYTYPEELNSFIGITNNGPVFFHDQPSVGTFNFTYRKMINDGSRYEIHFFTNVTIEPSEYSSQTLSASPDVSEFSWNFSTVPVDTAFGVRTGHFSIDSRILTNHSALRLAFEQKLYAENFSMTGFLNFIKEVMNPTEYKIYFGTNPSDWTLIGPDASLTTNQNGNWTANRIQGAVDNNNGTFQITDGALV